MNLRVVLVIMFVILCTLSIVVASDVAHHEISSADQDGRYESHIHHRPDYMQEFSQSHSDFNIWNALGNELDNVI